MAAATAATSQVQRDAGPSSRGTVDRYSPWRDVGERFPDWVVRVRLLDGPREVMCFQRRVILLDPGVSPAERRSSLAHAIAHIDLDHRSCDPGSRAERREERDADSLAARRLISFAALVEAVRWTSSPVEACEELDVDLDMLRARGARLHPSERAAVRAAMAHREDIA